LDSLDVDVETNFFYKELEEFMVCKMIEVKNSMLGFEFHTYLKRVFGGEGTFFAF
jgi:hypothetical protein